MNHNIANNYLRGGYNGKFIAFLLKHKKAKRSSCTLLEHLISFPQMRLEKLKGLFDFLYIYKYWQQSLIKIHTTKNQLSSPFN